MAVEQPAALSAGSVDRSRVPPKLEPLIASGGIQIWGSKERNIVVSVLAKERN